MILLSGWISPRDKTSSKNELQGSTEVEFPMYIGDTIPLTEEEKLRRRRLEALSRPKGMQSDVFL